MRRLVASGGKENGDYRSYGDAQKTTRDAVIDLHQKADYNQDLIHEIGKDLVCANNNLNNIVVEVKGQGEQLNRVHGNIQDTGVSIKRTDKLTNRMQTRAYCVKFLLHVLAFLMFVSIVVVLILKLTK